MSAGEQRKQGKLDVERLAEADQTVWLELLARCFKPDLRGRVGAHGRECW